jgi:type III restriction enzyme
MPTDIINAKAIQPLYKPWEMPDHHRLQGGVIKSGRRPSGIIVAQNLRAAVREWREGVAGVGEYAGVSDTTLELLNHWFQREHLARDNKASTYPFRYHFCQREAIETFIYLLEVRQISRLTSLVSEFGGPDAETAALGVNPEQDQWAKYAFKMATGSGKTKVMSLAIVWSYFHALRESDSPMTRHFVAIAPNVTVFERLKDDFAPTDGGPNIFDTDPLIPTAWRSDWNLNVILQDEASGAATGGTLYLTNIHRLYDISKRKGKEPETYLWAGPPVSKAKALDAGAELRDRVTSHKRVMVLNDEAHHVWDPDSAWNEALDAIHTGLRKRFGSEYGLVAQLDFSATPKDNKGQYFQHIACDFPLGEAVDSGIVKTPILGRASNLQEQPGDSAAIVYQRHLLLGYQRWLASREEWEKSGKKALMFVMTQDTKGADEITAELNTSPLFKELNGKTINLHTNLKGRIKKTGKGSSERLVFIESEKEISDDDLKALRKLSRELDSDPNHYCIVSVLMLREGWDVRNVTTIVPLRPYSSKANILPEQTLGRGLRRMTPPGDVDEIVTVVEHKAFSSLYQQELSRQGVDIQEVEVDKVPKTTVTIFPDTSKPAFDGLEIEVPQLSQEFRIVPELKDLANADVKAQFGKLGLEPLSLGETPKTEIDYEGRTLLTDEIVQQMKIQIPLLRSGFGAVSYYREQLERMCSIRGTHSVLAPLIQAFFEQVLFVEKKDLSDLRLIGRLGNEDVGEHVRAVFVPIIRSRIVRQEERVAGATPTKVSSWKPFQATHSETKPVLSAAKTLFNLVPCNRNLEVSVTTFLTKAPDVAAFAKNAGPQALRIDYLASGSRLAFYTPDFFVRSRSGDCYLVETKGREDKDVPAKARTAVAWCKSASSKSLKWTYVYVPQGVYERSSCNELKDLVTLCKPALQELLTEDVVIQPSLFARQDEASELRIDEFVAVGDFEALPPAYQQSVRHALTLFRFTEQKDGLPFSPAFNPLMGSLEKSSTALLVERLTPYVPSVKAEQKDFFEPEMTGIETKTAKRYQDEFRKLERTLVYRTPISPMGHLKFALEIGLKETHKAPIFEALRRGFNGASAKDLFEVLQGVYNFRNKYIAHQEHDAITKELARQQLKQWIVCLSLLNKGRLASRAGGPHPT